MSIIPGTLVKLPNGRQGIVIPSSLWRPDRVLVKVEKGGRKHWFKINECIPFCEAEQTGRSIQAMPLVQVSDAQ